MNPAKNPPAAAEIVPPILLTFLTNHPTKIERANARTIIVTAIAISLVLADDLVSSASRSPRTEANTNTMKKTTPPPTTAIMYGKNFAPRKSDTVPKPIRIDPRIHGYSVRKSTIAVA